MNESSIIPKLVPAENVPDYYQSIPKIIWQTMRTNHVPSIMKKFAFTWIEKNPEYDYWFFDDNDIIEFINREFPEYIEGYKRIKFGASKADLWRYLIMYKYGGVYSDLDCLCLNPLREWISSDADYVTQLGTNNDICQWLIISIPENPIFLRAAEKVLKNIKNNTCEANYKGFEIINEKIELRKTASETRINDCVMGLSGPPILQEAAEECFREGIISNLLQATQVICTSKKKSCNMSGNVLHFFGNIKYKKALKLLKSPHYSHNRRLYRFLTKIRIWNFLK